MRQLIVLFVVAFSLVLGAGCSGEKAPKADPNFKPTTNPSDITIPGQMRKMAPEGKSAPAPTVTPPAAPEAPK